MPNLPDTRISRRLFGRAAVLAGGAAAIWNEQALAQRGLVSDPGNGAVLLNANENPMGPCPEALEAMSQVLKRGGRYGMEEAEALVRALAQAEGVPPSHVRVYGGSSDPLFRSVVAFTSRERPFVMADPGFEVGQFAAATVGARSIRVPLRKDYSHDVKAMAAADPKAGLIYVCNPNNPTGTLTSRSDIEWLLANKPAGSVVLLDEAYLHFAAEAAPCCDLAAKGKDVIVLRTFSKLYGMAGLRAGAAIARPDLLSKLTDHGAFFVPTPAMVGARVSLGVKSLVQERRRLMSEIRNGLFEWMDKQNYRFVPSETNKFMVDVKRPGGEVVSAMAAQNVYIGRVWPAWPNHVRVSIGTREEMQKFRAAFQRVMNA